MTYHTVNLGVVHKANVKIVHATEHNVHDTSFHAIHIQHPFKEFKSSSPHPHANIHGHFWPSDLPALRRADGSNFSGGLEGLSFSQRAGGWRVQIFPEAGQKISA